MSFLSRYPLDKLSPAQMAEVMEAAREIEQADAQRRVKRSLYEFVKYFWHVIEPENPLVDGWVLEAVCLHLEAVTRGEIKRLLINVPPGSMKSLLCNVFWPAWEWCQGGRFCSLRYLSFSYSIDLTQRDNGGVEGRFSRLIRSEEYQAMFGSLYRVTKDNERKVINDRTGWKQASSIGGVGTGARADRVILDDPHNVKEGESELIRTMTVEWFANTMSNRLNSLDDSVIIIIMQRVHEMDVSGYVLEKGLPYEHLMIPAYSDGRRCQTCIGWIDPRVEEGINYWPERFSDQALDQLRATMLDFAWAGQYQQVPEARGGGLFKREWWVPWNPEEAEKWGIVYPKYPTFDLVIGAVDGAYTERAANDPSAMTVWGVWNQPGRPTGVILLAAWQAHLAFHDLLLRVSETASKWRLDKLLVEGKATGISIIQEMRRVYANAPWQQRKPRLLAPGEEWSRLEDESAMSSWTATEWNLEQVDINGGKRWQSNDKQSRAMSVAALWYEGVVYAPEVRIKDDHGRYTDEMRWASYADIVINQMAVFPHGAHDDLCLEKGTLIATNRGDIPIEEVRGGDLALTPDGFRPVLVQGFTGVRPTVSVRSLRGTNNHPVFTADGYKEMGAVVATDHLQRNSLCGFLKIALLRSSYSTMWNIAGWEGVANIISRNRNPIKGADPLRVFMSRFGSFIARGQYLRAMKFITRTGTHLISSLETWSAYRRACIAGCQSDMIGKSNSGTWRKFARWLACGTSLMKAAHGIGRSLLSPLHRAPDVPLAFSAMPISSINAPRAQSSAAFRAGTNITGTIDPIGRTSNASVRPVYNLSVKGAKCYFANGILVHNCDTAVMVMRWLRDAGLIKSAREATYSYRLEQNTHKMTILPPIYPS